MTPPLDRTPLVVAISLALSAIAPFAAPTNARSAAPPLPAHATRVVALGIPADELTLALVDPSRVLALDAFADDTAASNVVVEARRVALRVEVRSEAIAARAPDLVLLPAWAAPDLEASLHAFDIATLRVPTPHTIDGVRASIRTVAAALDARGRGEQLVVDMDASLAATRARCAHATRPTVLLDAGSGVSPGAHTLLAELVDVAGGELLLARTAIGLAPLSLERELSMDPDVLLVDAYRADARVRSLALATRSASGLDPRLDTLRAVRVRHVRPLEARLLLTTTHHIAATADALCDAIHAESAAP